MKYIATFISKYKYNNFSFDELVSICEMLKIKNLKIDETFNYDIQHIPYITLSFDDIDKPEICQQIVDRAVLLKNIIKIYSEGDSMDEIIQNNNKDEYKKEQESTESFKFDVDVRGVTINQTERLGMMNKFSAFPMKGKVDLTSYQRLFVIFQNKIINSEKSEIFFGRQIAGKDDKDTRFYTKYDLSHRKYLGPTSTDHILAFLMANLAQIKQNDVIIDPFAGTGSLLIPPTHYGAFVFGCDLDVRVLKGYSVGYVRKENKTVKKEADIFTNFDDYGLPRPQIIRQDINHPGVKKNNHVFDAIICDPPYGYRACSKKTGLSEYKKEKREKRINKKKEEMLKENENNEENEESEEEENEDNKEKDEFNPDYVLYGGEKRLFLPLKKCEVSQIFENLINFANDSLKKDGILVCLYPTKRTKKEKDLVHLPINFPQHKSFKLLRACENQYSTLKSRWCLVYRKIE